MSLINAHSLDPAMLYEVEELETATQRYLHVRPQPIAGEEASTYRARLLQVKTVDAFSATLTSKARLGQPEIPKYLALTHFPVSSCRSC